VLLIVNTVGLSM